MATNLDNLNSARSRLNSIGERIALIEYILSAGNRVLSESSGGDRADKLRRNMVLLEERESSLLAAGTSLENEIWTVEQAIQRLTEPQRMIVRLRYFEGLQWRDVAARARYSEKHCIRLSADAYASVQAELQRCSNPDCNATLMSETRGMLPDARMHTDARMHLYTADS